MSFRYMRVIVMFDLPTVSYEDRKEYVKFRKFLVNEGFIMMQESIYTKLALNGSVATLVRKKVRKNVPKDGLVQMLTITEKQFASMEYLIGYSQKTIIENTERLIII